MSQLKCLEVVDVLKKCANHPSAFLATNQGTQHFLSNKVPGLIAYRLAGRNHVIIAAGVSAKTEHKDTLIEDFLAWVKKKRKKIIAVQMLRDDANILARHNFTVNQIGSSYSLALNGFKIAGTPFMKLRNKISRARRAGVEIKQLGKDLSFTPELESQLKKIDTQWLKQKHAKELAFLIGELGDLNNMDMSVKRLFVGFKEGDPVAYILYTASFGAYQGWMHDLTRRLPDAPTGVMELININAIESFMAEKAQYLNFGFTPLVGLSSEFEIPRVNSRLAQKIFLFLSKHGRFIYPADSQLQYKLKWSPNIVLPEYIAFQDGFSLEGLWNFLKLTQAL
ncbi:MAG: DUF2156 domain-containing protein [Calothrix sp. MO_167.B42]|nr:DUF2156 domain-containing protein [Calothrix sp. MO_167.B42]